jgi:TorA maturation chaperone TorD
MSDIAAFLRAFGLVLDARRHERIDHVACELEFLAFLARKEAHAIEAGDAEMLAETLKGARLFLKDHLGRFAPSFARRVMNADPGGTYGRLAEICLEFVKAEGARLGANVGPEALRLRAPIDDRAPMACGSPDGCAPGPCGPGAPDKSGL